MTLGFDTVLGIQLFFRGLWGRHAERLSRFLAWTTVISLTLGIASLIMMSSVMNGFDKELRARLLSVVPHIVVNGSHARSDIMRDISSGQLSGVSGFLGAEGMVVSGSGQHYLNVQGVSGQDPMMQAIENKGVLIGRWPAFNAEVSELVIGAPLARRAGLSVGSDVIVLFPRVEHQRLIPVWHRFRITGLFALGAEVDYVTAIASAQALSQLLNQSAHWRLTMREPGEVLTLKSTLSSAGFDLLSSWDETYASFFRAVKIEKMMMIALLGLLILLSLISLLSSVRRALLEKMGMASMLRATGMTQHQVRRVFITYGVSMSLLALVSGTVLGILATIGLPDLMAWLESLTGFSVVKGSYFSDLPIDLRWSDIALICGGSLLASTFTVHYACRSIVQVDLNGRLR